MVGPSPRMVDPLKEDTMMTYLYFSNHDSKF